MTNAFDQLQSWFVDMCDGDWEHDSRVKLESLDNPGWSLSVNLADTPGGPFAMNRVDVAESELRWWSCWMDSQEFRAACGPECLDNVLRIFLGLVQGTTSTS